MLLFLLPLATAAVLPPPAFGQQVTTVSGFRSLAELSPLANKSDVSARSGKVPIAGVNGAYVTVQADCLVMLFPVNNFVRLTVSVTGTELDMGYDPGISTSSSFGSGPVLTTNSGGNTVRAGIKFDDENTINDQWRAEDSHHFSLSEPLPYFLKANKVVMGFPARGEQVYLAMYLRREAALASVINGCKARQERDEKDLADKQAAEKKRQQDQQAAQAAQEAAAKKAAADKAAAEEASYAPEVPGRITVAPEVMNSLLMTRTNIIYPPIARMARISGPVTLHVLISARGRVESIQAVSGQQMLISAAADAVRQWRWRQYIVDGGAHAVDTMVTINFGF